MTTEKPFLVFAGEQYYPSGGWDDFRGAFETLEAAKDYMIKNQRDWGHIIDIRNFEEVYCI
jgi:hypothetical protein